MSENLFNDDDWNSELEEEVDSGNAQSLVVYSRDWTVETVISQIKINNIDLNPKFQRRNAWNDSRKSKLIESLIIGIPIPEIVLAEDPIKKKSFIVIDGKQRLLTLAGFFYPEKFDAWKKPILQGLRSRPELNGLDKESLNSNSLVQRELLNSGIRCTVISNYTNNSVLYDIFYRLNTGSVPLSSQELRQVLNKGAFADYLISVTNEIIPLHRVMRLAEPDTRLRDAELLLRYISFKLRGSFYKGNLSEFLDKTMELINNNWDQYQSKVEVVVAQFNETTTKLLELLGEKVGRKYTNNTWESRFNRALFEVEIYCFGLLSPQVIDSLSSDALKEKLATFMNDNQKFLATIESSTKDVERYRTRYLEFQNFINSAYGQNIDTTLFSI